jgi:hypothetical protein
MKKYLPWVLAGTAVVVVGLAAHKFFKKQQAAKAEMDARVAQTKNLAAGGILGSPGIGGWAG